MPKKSAADTLTTPQKRARQQSNNLVTAATDYGMLDTAKPSTFPRTLPSKGWIHKRKGKYLFAFPGKIGFMKQASGKIAQLENLDTLNPVCYMDAEKGKYKLEGTVVHIKNRMLTIQCNPKAAESAHMSKTPAVVAEDVFDKLVIFSKVTWIGTESPPHTNTAESNTHTFSFGCGSSSAAQARATAAATDDDEDEAEEVRPTGGRVRRTISKTTKYTYSSSSEAGDDGAASESSVEVETKVATQRASSGRTTAVGKQSKRKSAAVVSDSDERSDDGDDSNDDEDDEDDDDAFSGDDSSADSSGSDAEESDNDNSDNDSDDEDERVVAVGRTKRKNASEKPVVTPSRVAPASAPPSSNRSTSIWGGGYSYNNTSIWASPDKQSAAAPVQHEPADAGQPDWLLSQDSQLSGKKRPRSAVDLVEVHDDDE